MEEKSKNNVVRDDKGRIVSGVANPDGRGKMTEEEKRVAKAIRKTTKEYIAKYEEELAKALPELSPVLINKALEGDISALKEVNDRVMGKPRQTVGVDGGLDENDKALPLLAGKSNVSNNDSNKEITESKEEA